jgi:hypothetical protein
MANNNFNIGCGGAIAIFIGLMGVIGALVYASNHMDTASNFIIGTIIVVLIIIIMVKST